MKKILSIFFLVFFFALSVVTPVSVHAQTPAQQLNQASSSAQDPWVVDPEVTFIGKNAARSGLLLDWTLQNYNWVCVTRNPDGTCNDNGNPLAKFWGFIVVTIVVPLLFIVILATAVVIIITHGKSLTIMRFIPRFVAVILLIVFSYSLLQFFYQFTDLIQGFFLRSQPNSICPPNCISQKDLLYVGWDYRSFVGLRLLGDANAESAFVTLLLTKLTALTYFVMVGILLMRKIILWFFVIVSPIFPLLLLYYPTRNTGKIWIGEFFRWLLYAPLFAIFLRGLVELWRQQIPLSFANPNIGTASQIVFPTAVNILLGGPKQFVTPNNSVNLTETFALYVVALIMLWIVILLPWILLQIFLDYAANFEPGNTAVMKTLVNLATSNKPVIPPPAPVGGLPPGPGKEGATIALPFAKKFSGPVTINPTGMAMQIPTGTTIKSTFTQPAYLPNANISANVTTQALNLANMSVPNLRDIAVYDKAMYSNDTSRMQQVTLARETLEKIANPVVVTNTVEREKITELREKLVEQSQQGNQLATSILNAANNTSRNTVQASTNQIKNVLQQIANPALTNNVVDRERMSKMHEMLEKQSKETNNQLASSILGVNEKTGEKEIEKIRDQLMQEKSNSVASSVISTINSSAQKEQMKSVLQQIANPALSTTTFEKEKYSKLHDALEKESKENNNQLATTILSVSDTTSEKELEKISEQLNTVTNNTVAAQVKSVLQQAQSTTKVKTVLQQVANPTTAVGVEKEKTSKLHEALMKASQEGNQLATSILSVSDKTSESEIQKLQQKIQQAKEQGEPIAKQISEMTEKTSSLPALNRVQTVSKEDYEAVRQMWQENYRNLEVPQGMAGTRSEWIKDDVAKINTIISELSSTNPEEVSKGMDEVSSLLPFLMVGGFSQTEIIEYLKAKQEAGKQVAAELAQEEEEQVTVKAKTGTAQAQQAMAVEADAPSASTPAAPSASSTTSATDDDDDEPSPLAAPLQTANVVQPQVSVELVQLANLKIPTVKDVAMYETNLLRKDETKLVEAKKFKDILTKIADPTPLPAGPEKEQFQKLRDKLLEENKKGNVTAGTILAAANHAAEKQLSIALPTANQLQTVEKASYEEVKKMWEENYKTLPVPSPFTSDDAGRIEWIKDDITQMQSTIEQLTSNDTETKKEGMKRLSSILPFLLLGGFSFKEMITYLETKIEAAKTVVATLEKEEAEKETVPAAASGAAKKEQTMQAEENKQ